MSEIQALYKRYSADVFRFALYLCGDKSQAEDITAETFTRLLTRENELVTRTVKAYLLTITRNIFLEFSRREAKQQLLETKDDADLTLEFRYQKARELDAMQRILQSMNIDDRCAILMRAEGLGYSEISRILNMSQTAVKVKVHRLRKKLSQKLN